MPSRSSKNSRSSKTAHVLNLLSGGPQPAEAPQSEPAAPSAGQQAPAHEEPAPEAAARPLVPPILEVARSNSQALSAAIHQALEEAFPEEPAQDPPAEASAGSAAPPRSDPEEAAAPEQAAPPEADSPPEDAELPPPPPEPAVQPEPAGAAVPPEPARSDAAVLNVMELLVDEKLERYVRLFGLCRCPRCLADAKALALTRLPAQYAVLSAAERAPRISLYRAKFDTEVTTQILYACKAVMDAPRHAPENGG